MKHSPPSFHDSNGAKIASVAPTLTSISPATAVAVTGADLTVTGTGTNFDRATFLTCWRGHSYEYAVPQRNIADGGDSDRRSTCPALFRSRQRTRLARACSGTLRLHEVSYGYAGQYRRRWRHCCH